MKKKYMLSEKMGSEFTFRYTKKQIAQVKPIVLNALCVEYPEHFYLNMSDKKFIKALLKLEIMIKDKRSALDVLEHPYTSIERIRRREEGYHALSTLTDKELESLLE